MTRPVTQRGQQTRQNLLDAAEAIFGDQGYDRASIFDITRRAKVAQGTFYIYFSDKKAIFVELIRELSHHLRHRMADAALQAGHSRMDVERAGFRAFFDFICEHRNLYRIVRQAEFVDDGLYRWYYEKISESYTQALTEAMEQGQIQKLNAECIAFCLMGIGDFLGMKWVLWENSRPPDEVFETMMDFIAHGLSLSVWKQT